MANDIAVERLLWNQWFSAVIIGSHDPKPAPMLISMNAR